MKLSDEAMTRLAEEGSAAAMLLLWQEAHRARESEVELLEGLKLAASCLQHRRFEMGHLEEIRAAIAKAEGEGNL
jgi:hypothetical protein